MRSFSCNNKASILQTLNKFPEISDKIRNIVIENRDFEPLMKAYDRPDALFYSTVEWIIIIL
ncbi:MAG: hypothetical protein LBC56_00550 [Oscillospiraceae bacterium]|nr:hypothetical protein [Oscillospiraceae bacterium]